MIKQLITTISLVSILFLMNCATMFSENQYIYSVASNPLDADVTVIRDNYPIGKYKTPCKITIKMDKESVLKLEAKGYQEKQVLLERGFNGWVWANLFLGGAAGIAIDYFTGSMYKPMDEKTDFNIILEPVTPTVEDKKGKKVSLLSPK